MGPADEGLLLQATLASLACVTESVRCERLGGDTTRRSFLLSDPGHIGLRLSLALGFGLRLRFWLPFRCGFDLTLS